MAPFPVKCHPWGFSARFPGVDIEEKRWVPMDRPTHLALFAALLILALPARADVILLKNGNRIQGKILQRRGEEILVELPFGQMRIPSREIETIQEESEDAYLITQADRLLYHGFHGDAIDLYEKARNLRPESNPIREKLIRAHEGHGTFLVTAARYEDAESVYRGILDLDPGNQAATAGLAEIERIRRWTEAEIRRAQERLAQGSWTEALGLLLPVLERNPDRKDVKEPIAICQARLGDRDLAGEDFIRAADRYHQALVLCPDLAPRLENRYVLAEIQRVLPELNRQDFQSARATLERARNLVPENDAIRYYLGLAYEGLGRFNDAAELYRLIAGTEGRAIDIGKEIDVLRREAEAEIARGVGVETATEEVLPGTWRRITTPHFIVHHRNARIGRLVADRSEYHWRRIARKLGLTKRWEPRCAVYVHPDRAAYVKATKQPAWSTGVTEIETRFGLLREHAIHSFQTCPQLLHAVLPHEITHAVTAAVLGYECPIPVWAGEGLAILSEPGYKHGYYEGIISHARARRTLIPVGDLVRSSGYPDEQQMDLFYAQSFSLVRYLIRRRSLSVFIAFIRSAADGALEGALKQHYGISSPSELANLWTRTIQVADRR